MVRGDCSRPLRSMDSETRCTSDVRNDAMNAERTVPSLSDRRGMTLAEVAVSSVLLVAVMGVVFQAMVASTDGQRALDRRQAAVQAAVTTMERLAARPWDDLTPQSVRNVRLPDAVDRSLAEATVRVDIDQLPATDLPEAEGPKRITVEVGWTGRLAEPPLKVRLVTLRYPPPSGSGETP